MRPSSCPSPAPSPPQIAIHADPPDDPAIVLAAQATAATFGLAVGSVGDAGLRLTQTRDGLELRDDTPGCRPVRVNLLQLDASSPVGRSRRQPLAKALGLGKRTAPPHVLDATAGFGEDAWLMAAWGCQVVCRERQPVVAAMLTDALRRAALQAPEIAERLAVVFGDARTANPQPTRPFDVIYLDPMFPAGRKTLERRPLQLLRAIAGDDADAHDLLTWAVQTGVPRVVVKRPRRGARLGDQEPTVTFHGKAVRWDVYATPSRH